MLLSHMHIEWLLLSFALLLYLNRQLKHHNIGSIYFMVIPRLVVLVLLLHTMITMPCTNQKSSPVLYGILWSPGGDMRKIIIEPR